MLIVLCVKPPHIDEKQMTLFPPFPEPFSIDKVGEGPLSLHNFGRKTGTPELAQEVVLISKNPRPGSLGEKPDFLLYLKSSGDEYKAKQGEQIFLSCDSLPGGLAPVYRFSSAKTPLWIRPEFSEKEGMKLEVGLFTLSKENGVFQEEKTQIKLTGEAVGRKKKENLPFMEMLEKSKLWGHDVVLSGFAGPSYAHLKDKVKVEIPCFDKRIFCFVGKGDFLLFEEGKWIPGDASKEIEGKPIAQVRKVAQKSVELEAWDPETFQAYSVKLEFNPSFRGAIKAEGLPHTVRSKSGKQISCFFGKRKLLLKEGDWLLKTRRGWRKLKRPGEVSDYLRHKFFGELFIFESLVKEQGKLLMKGFLVDEMRTFSQPFSCPVVLESQDLKASAAAEKKRLFSTTGNGTSITYIPSAISNSEPDENTYE